MIFFIYNLFITVALIFFIPIFLIRSLIQKELRAELLERMGYFSYYSVKKSIWLHAASVGEVTCSIPLLKKINEQFPQTGIMVTTMTHTGREIARRSFPKADQFLFLPIDYPFFIRKFIKKLNPIILLIAETEIWPNLIATCGRSGIPVVIFNGRISEKSYHRYRLFRFFFRRILNYVLLFLVQSKQDHNRMLKIGATAERIKVTGNIKFDLTPSPFLEEKRMEFLKMLELNETNLILIAGSTHHNEEEIILDIYKDLKKLFPELILIVAPRHIQRLQEIEEILKNKSFSWTKRSLYKINKNQSNKFNFDVILLDTVGELKDLYSIASLVFIGGSLIPVGGHNPIEPLVFKRCVIFGPHMFNFKEISSTLTQDGGAIQVKDSKDLYENIKRLLSDKELRNRIGEIGHRIIENHRGAIEKIFSEIKGLLTNYNYFKK